MTITKADIGRKAVTIFGEIVTVLESEIDTKTYPYSFNGFAGLHYLVTENGTRPDNYDLIAWHENYTTPETP